jgi:lipooligosaccharide transport system permease protein
MAMDAPALRYVQREAAIYRRLWRGNAFSQFVQPTLYLLAMGVGLGGLISAAGHQVDGLSYLDFVAPGLMAATALQNATGESLWPVMAGFKWMRHYHGMVASPMSPGDVYVGNLTWMTIRLTASSAAFLVVASVLGAISSFWAVLAVPAAVLGAVSFAAVLTAFAATQDTDHNFALILRFLMLPMFLFSGTFFPVSQLPALLRPVAWVAPLWHSVELCRDATTGTLGPGGLVGVLAHVAVLLGYFAVGAAWGLRSFRARLGP